VHLHMIIISSSIITKNVLITVILLEINYSGNLHNNY